MNGNPPVLAPSGETYVRNKETYVEIIGTNIIIGSLNNRNVKILDYEDEGEAKKVFEGIKAIFCFEDLPQDKAKAGNNMVNF